MDFIIPLLQEASVAGNVGNAVQYILVLLEDSEAPLPAIGQVFQLDTERMVKENLLWRQPLFLKW